MSQMPIPTLEWDQLNQNHGQVTSKNEQLLGRIKELQENLNNREEKIAEKDSEISELKARLRYYEEDLGFRKGGGDMPRLKRLNYMLGNDYKSRRYLGTIQSIIICADIICVDTFSAFSKSNTYEH